VRRAKPDGTLALGNPAPGHLGVGQQLGPGDYARLGPWSAVWLPLDPPAALAAPGEFEQERAALIGALAHVCDVLVEDTLGSDRTPEPERQEAVAAAKAIREQMLGPRPR
jgi:hypothetical protein